jgi:hypothetical protein
MTAENRAAGYLYADRTGPVVYEPRDGRTSATLAEVWRELEGVAHVLILRETAAGLEVIARRGTAGWERPDGSSITAEARRRRRIAADRRAAWRNPDRPRWMHRSEEHTRGLFASPNTCAACHTTARELSATLEESYRRRLAGAA